MSYNHQYNNMTKYIKSRTWGAVVYPESAPDNWIEILEETRIQFAVSPLHDKDVNPDGEIKKAHWHIILCLDGPVTEVAAKKLSDKVGAPNPIKLESVRGAYRYFTHMDNPDKFQYDDTDIKVFNGFDISSYISMTKEEKYEAISKIKRLIHERGIIEYIDLLDVVEEEDYSLFKVTCDHTILITAMLRSARHKRDRP